MTWKPLLFLPGRSPAGSRAARADPSPRRDEEGGRGLQVRRGVGAPPPDPPLSSPLRSQMAARREGRGPRGGTIKAICGTGPRSPLPTDLGADGEGGTRRSRWETQSGSGGESGGKGPRSPPAPSPSLCLGRRRGGGVRGCALPLHLVTFNEQGLLCSKRALGGRVTLGYGEGTGTTPTPRHRRAPGAS